jgi:hypothetical protein
VAVRLVVELAVGAEVAGAVVMRRYSSGVRSVKEVMEPVNASSTHTAIGPSSASTVSAAVSPAARHHHAERPRRPRVRG